MSGNIHLDSNSGSWEQATISGSVPVGTTWLLAQVFDLEASLADAAGGLQAGFVDGAELGISPVPVPVPEPGTWALLALGLAAISSCTRRHS